MLVQRSITERGVVERASDGLAAPSA